MWTYQISTGQLSHDGEIIGTGYSGAPGIWKNNPHTTNIPGHGAIPVGVYDIGSLFTSPQTGPNAMRLTPKPGTDTFGRADFEMHGDSIAHPGSASHGCVIMPLPIRLKVAGSGDSELEVIA